MECIELAIAYDLQDTNASTTVKKKSDVHQLWTAEK